MIVPAIQENIPQAIARLQSGNLAIFPTETVYGIGGDATQGRAVAEIFKRKKRPQINPLIAHVSDQEMAAHYVNIDALSQQLMEHFWPGALTLILPIRENSRIHPLVSAGLPNLALRSPKGFFKDVIAALAKPVAAPSANQSGKISPTNAKAASIGFNLDDDLIFDDGPCAIGVESTIIKIVKDDVFLLRAGGIPVEEIEEQIDRPVYRGMVEQNDKNRLIQAPGMLVSHYAPEASLRLNVTEIYEGEALLAFGASRVRGFRQAVHYLNLSPSGDLKEAAMNLFDYLHQLDQKSVVQIAVEPIPLIGLGAAINDRLSRAAAPRGF